MVEPVKPAAEAPRRRGRPRDPQIRRAILDAARALLDEQGPAALTMEGVAQRAGVGKPTVYRWWPNRHAVAMAALMDAPPPHAAAARAGSALQRLEQQLLEVAHTLATRSGRHVTSIIAAADPDSEVAKAFRHHFVLARRGEGRALLELAMRDGELHADVAVELALDQIYGAIFFRLLLGHAPVDASFVRALLAQVLRGLAAG